MASQYNKTKTAFTSQNNTHEELYQEALKYKKAWQFQQALDTIDRALSNESDNNRSLKLRSEALAGLGRMDDAIKQAEKIIQSVPRPNANEIDFIYNVYLHLAYCYKEKRDIMAVISTYEKAIQSNPGKAQAYSQLADYVLQVKPTIPNTQKQIYDKLHNTDVIQLYKKALEYSNIASIHNSLGLAYKQQGEPLLAAEQFDIALNQKQDYAEAYYNRAQIHVEQSNYQTAIDYFDHAYKLKPGNIEALNQLAIAQYHLNKEKEALETLAEAVKLDPKNPISLTNMGFIYDEMEDPNNALKFIKQALDIDPRFFEAYIKQARVYRKQNKFQEAINSLKNAENNGADKHKVLTEIALCYYDQNQFEQAQNSLQEAQKYHKSDQNETLMGLCEYRNKRFDDFEKRFKKIIDGYQGTKGEPQTRLYLAAHYIQTQKYTEAEKLLVDQAHHHPHDAEAHNLHAQCLFLNPHSKEQELKKAHEHAKKAVQIERFEPRYRFQKGYAKFKIGLTGKAVANYHKGFELVNKQQQPLKLWFSSPDAQITVQDVINRKKINLLLFELVQKDPQHNQSTAITNHQEFVKKYNEITEHAARYLNFNLPENWKTTETDKIMDQINEFKKNIVPMETPNDHNNVQMQNQLTSPKKKPAGCCGGSSNKKAEKNQQQKKQQ